MGIIADHYVTDRRIGEACVINGHDAFTDFNADVISISPSAGGITSTTSPNVSRSFFNVYSQSFKPSKLIISFYVGGIDRNDLYTNVSMLINECKNCIINTAEDTFEYVCILNNYDVKEQEIEWWQKVTLTFESIRRLALLHHESKGAVTELRFFNPGVVESGLRIIAKSNSQQNDVQIGDVMVNTLHANQDFIISGIDGTVTENGINRFNQTDLVNFPRVHHGENVLKCTKALNLAVEFYPTFIV